MPASPINLGWRSVKTHRADTLLVADMIEVIGRIAQYTSGLTREAFLADRMRIDAVVRNLEIIGEAASHVPTAVAARHAELPWAEMRTMRNVVIHEYHGVNLEIVWQTVREDLPPLVTPLENMFNEE